MDGMGLALTIGVLALVGLGIFWVIRSDRASRGARERASRALGFTPFEPPAELIRQIAALHQRPGSSAGVDNYRLENVWRKRMADGDVILFDLIDASGDDVNVAETQAVATLSSALDLPAFAVFPRTEIAGPLGDMANQVMGWLVARFGDPVDFPQVPEFGQRYFVSSRDPEGTRLFLDESRLRRLASTQLLAIRAGGELFTVSRIDRAATPQNPEAVSQRLQEAHYVYTVFVN